MIRNMRDLGGLRTADGRKIKPQMLIRSAHLAQAEEQDTENISEVIDLRTPAERQESPDHVKRTTIQRKRIHHPSNHRRHLV